MEITEVRIKLMDEPGERLQAFCSVTFDNAFVVRDLKIIDGTNGPFVAMPSRKLTARCGRCGCKNHLRASYCNQCGTRLGEDRVVRDSGGRAKLYADIAHPINSQCRERIQQRIIEAFHQEIERSKQPDYVPSYDDFDSDYDFSYADNGHAAEGPHFAKGSTDAAGGAKRASDGAPGPHRHKSDRRSSKAGRDARQDSGKQGG